jgi:hypothetical protein
LSKTYSSIVLTDDGIQIDSSDPQDENAELRIRESLEPDSNVMLDRDVHLKKAWRSILSTEEGIHIDVSDLQ